MIIRAIFAFLIVFLLLPHHPDIGLPRVLLGNVEQAVVTLRADMASGASRAATDLRSSRD